MNEQLSAADAIQEWVERYGVAHQDRDYYFNLYEQYQADGASTVNALSYVYTAIQSYNVVRRVAHNGAKPYTPTWAKIVCFCLIVAYAIIYILGKG